MIYKRPPIDLSGLPVQPGYVIYNGHKPKIRLSGKVDFERDKQRYGSSPHEEGRAIIERFPSSTPTAIHLKRSTSHLAKALVEDRTNGAYTVAVEGLILTADDYFLFGVRSQGNAAGKLLTAPAGCVSTEGKNPIYTSFLAETAEETGIQADELSNIQLLGHQIDDGLGVYVFHAVYAAETKKKLAEVQEHHGKSLQRYNMLFGDGWHPILIRDRLQLEGLMVDSWEYTSIIGIPRKEIDTILNQRPTLRQRVREPRVSHFFKNRPMLNIGVRPLQMWQEQN